MDTPLKTLNELISRHTSLETECRGMASAAFGCGDMLAGRSYAASADFHQKEAARLTTQAQMKVLDMVVKHV